MTSQQGELDGLLGVLVDAARAEGPVSMGDALDAIHEYMARERKVTQCVHCGASGKMTCWSCGRKQPEPA